MTSTEINIHLYCNFIIYNIAALSILGFAAPLYAKFNNGTVYGYIPGEIFAQHELKDPNKSALVAKHLAKLHRANIAAEPKKPICLTVFELPEKYTNPKTNEKFVNNMNLKKLKEEMCFLEEQLVKNNNPVHLSMADIIIVDLILKIILIPSPGGNTKVTDAEVEELYREVAKFALVSLFYYSVWTLLSSEISDIKYDFMEYAYER
ncbi:4506_t:CDS:2 [Ambispora gerdemannii]|uniref:ethanolamine kinase n=1 Tax=Ambispora gerdemannii TaxID=144530 RepID=A0A9N9CYD1_9GLOM|nr:4506_t:CDS:2 [Ambispora gerdemannii]